MGWRENPWVEGADEKGPGKSAEFTCGLSGESHWIDARAHARLGPVRKSALRSLFPLRFFFRGSRSFLKLKMEYAEAMWAYQGSEANEISFPAGAQLAILRKVSAEWWEAQYEGRVGYFPAAYARIVSTGMKEREHERERERERERRERAREREREHEHTGRRVHGTRDMVESTWLRA